MPDPWSVLGFFSRRRQQKARQAEDDREVFVQKYQHFREVLRHNNAALLVMGDMQEKAGGSFVFDRAYVRSAYDSLAEGIRRMIENLNQLTDQRYEDLGAAFEEIDTAVRKLLLAKLVIPETEAVLPLTELGEQSAAAAGGKLALLGELANALHLPVPPGFVITTGAYQAFLRHNRIEETLTRRVSRLDLRDYGAVQAASAEIQQLIAGSELPPGLEGKIMEAHQRLCRETGRPDLRVSVRSSALHEDIQASFAGQYETALHVRREDLLFEYRRILASQFTPRALLYYRDRDFALEEMAMAVGVLAMVDARASGILYSRDPEDPADDRVLLNAVWGLGAYAVGGAVPAQAIAVRGTDRPAIEREPWACQPVMLVGDEGPGTCETPLPDALREKTCLKDDQVLQLVSWARLTENHFGRPQDLEWALDPDDRLFLLQTRPLRLAAPREQAARERGAGVKGHRLLLEKGAVASQGVGAGPVFIGRGEEDLARFPEGGVLVLRHSRPEFAAVLSRASAVIADIGTVLGHLATVAREYGVPAIFNTEQATRVLTNGQEVTVDADFANVYEGIVEELLRDQAASKPAASPALKQLREILKRIAPLNLTDPRSNAFSPRGCETLHDITRFSHEMAMRAIFELSRESHFTEASARQLVSEVPLQWWIIDLEDGVQPGVKGNRVQIREIVSLPLLALWEGMTALPWKGPPPVDTKGFMSVMLSASRDPSIDPAVGKLFADRNYILVSRNFCNVSTRLGFHFSTIEAYLGDQENENYASFVYTGGGADEDRKRRRATLIGRLLELFDFRTEQKADTLFARIEGHRRAFLAERMKVLGYIVVHTRQMDMVMFKDAMVDWYYKEMSKEIRSILSPEP